MKIIISNKLLQKMRNIDLFINQTFNYPINKNKAITDFHQ